MKMNKEALKKLKMPMKSKDPMLDSSDVDMADMDDSAEESAESPSEEAAEQPSEELKHMSDDELAQELEARGYKCEKPEGAEPEEAHSNSDASRSDPEDAA